MAARGGRVGGGVILVCGSLGVALVSASAHADSGRAARDAAQTAEGHRGQASEPPSAAITSENSPMLEPAEHAAPPRPALWGGLMAFGAGYGLSAGLALADPHAPAAAWLWLPLAGPWISLSAQSRGDDRCAAFDTGSCEDRSQRSWGLALDGVLQGVGALLVVGSLAFEGGSGVGFGLNQHGPVAAGRF